VACIVQKTLTISTPLVKITKLIKIWEKWRPN